MSATLLAAGSAAIIAAVQKGSTTAEKLVEASFARAGEVDAGPSGLNCILSSDANVSRIAAGVATTSGALAGVPVVLKDNIATPAHCPALPQPQGTPADGRWPGGTCGDVPARLLAAAGAPHGCPQQFDFSSRTKRRYTLVYEH